MKIFFLFLTICSIGRLPAQESLMQKVDRNFYSNQDSTYYFLDKLYDHSVKNGELINSLEALTKINDASLYYKNFEKLKSSLEKEDALFTRKEKKIDSLPEGTFYKFYYWYHKGSYFYNLNDYDRSEKFFFNTITSLEKFPDSIVKNDYSGFLTVANNYIATMYRNQFKYAIAEEFYTENLRLHHVFESSKDEIYDTKNLIASLKSAEKEYATSNRYARESIHYYLNNSPNSHLNSLLSTTLLLMNNYLKLNQADSARIYLKKAKPYLLKRQRFKVNYLKVEANIAKVENNHTEALNLFKDALKELEDTEGNGDYMAQIYNEIGELYYSNKNLRDALAYNEKALQLFTVKENFNIELRANSKVTILKILNDISTIHDELGEDNNLNKVIENGFITIEKLEELRKSFFNDSDKQVLVENVLPIFELGIEASYQRYKNTANQVYIDTAFTFFERSKSTILLDALYKNNATRFSGIPDDLLEREKVLKVTIAQLEKKFKTQDEKIQDQLFKYKREYETLIQNIEVNHPAYFDLKHNTQVVSIPKVQKSLHPGELVLSYFYGDNAVYVISITNKDKSIVKISTDNTDIQNILELQKMISDPKTTISNLAKASFQIYQKFVAPAITNTGIKKIVIMPDGILRNIPFEVLNTSNTKNDYLLNTVNISYINSATLWFQLQNSNKNKNESLLAFAPSFNNDSDFSNLPNATREVVQINQFFKGNVFVDKEATLENFKTNIKNHNIIHLATHAQTDNEIPEYSFLAFTPDKNKEYLLYVNDLYAMNINAEMVTLSACKSGVGDLKKGEGLLSLSRAFFYAGAKSLVYTLWNINDSSSSEIMEKFYENLSDGASKDEALRNAKLTFLEKHKEDNFKHPYYWSSFIISGNTTPLVSDSYLVWYVVASVLLIAIVVFRKKLY